MESLSTPEQAELAQCVATIERGIQSFYETGLAILKLRNGRLYRQTHSSLESFLKDRFGLERSRAYQLLYAAEVCSNLQGSEVLPENEHQLRPLATLPAKDQRKVWNEACAINGGETPTARQIKRTSGRDFPGTSRPKTRATSRDRKSRRIAGILARTWSRTCDRATFVGLELADWFLEGEEKYGAADKLIDEVPWSGPPIAAIKRKAAVARQFPQDARTADISFETYNQALAIGKPSLVYPGVVEADVKASIQEARSRDLAAKKKSEVGQEIESDELVSEMTRFFPRLWNGLVQHIGYENEAKAIEWVTE